MTVKEGTRSEALLQHLALGPATPHDLAETLNSTPQIVRAGIQNLQRQGYDIRKVGEDPSPNGGRPRALWQLFEPAPNGDAPPATVDDEETDELYDEPRLPFLGERMKVVGLTLDAADALVLTLRFEDADDELDVTLL